MADRRPALDLQLPPNTPHLVALVDALLDDFAPFAIEDDLGLGPGPRRRVHFTSAGDRDAAEVAIRDQLGATGIRATPIAVVDEGWAERSQAALRAVRVDDVVVAPPWDLPPPDTPQTTVIITPSMGFGTGHHASTRTCLRALQRLSLAGRQVIDVGTGSGVLAITAAKRGAAGVLAFDRDPDALATAEANVTRNAVAPIVTLRQIALADLDRSDASTGGVVVANLPSPTLTAAGATLPGLVASDGVLIVGGLLAAEESEICRAFGSQATVASRDREGDWVALTIHLHPHTTR